MDLYEDDVTGLVADIWSSMTGIAMGPTGDTVAAGPTMTGFVHINGAWQGTVTLECPAALAVATAAAMFGLAEDELAAEEILDSLGEMTNMTGGGIKALLPGPSQLSIPTVVEGEGYRVTVPGTEELAELHFAGGGHVIAVRVLRRIGGAPEAEPAVTVDALA